MFNKFNVEAENEEIILKNNHGDHVIIPANKRNWVLKKIKAGCNTCIDALVETLPVASEYAEFGSIYGGGDEEAATSEEAKRKSFVDKIEEHKKFYESYWDARNKGKDVSKFDKALVQKYGKKISWEDAIKYIELSGLKGKDLAEFNRKFMEQGAVVQRPERWQKETTDPNFKAPITQEEIEAYNDYQKKTQEVVADERFSKLKGYLEQNQYAPMKGFTPHNLTGAQILANAKQKGMNIVHNPDGTFEMSDDETTYTDTNNPTGSRIYNPNAVYQVNRYLKGNDVVNYYAPQGLSPYTNRVPTEEEAQEYQQGSTYQAALTPQNKVTYVNKYLDPQSNTTMYSGGSADDIERYKKAKSVSDTLNEFYKSEEGKAYLAERQKEADKVYKKSPSKRRNSGTTKSDTGSGKEDVGWGM